MNKRLLIGIGLLFVLLLLSVSALADGYPESAHPYENSADQTWTYTYPTSVEYMQVTFSAETSFENNYDYLFISDAGGNETRYTGDSLAGKTLYFRGNTVTLRLTSDSSVTKYGFQITSIAAATQAEYDAPRYTMSGGTLTAFQGAVENLIIPSTIDGQTVTAIGSWVFADNSSLTSVTIPDTVTVIGSNAFEGCAQLETVILPDGLTQIGGSAFKNCAALTSITIPNSVTSLGPYVFYGCASLETAVLSSGLTAIGSYAFYNCAALTSITVPSSVTSIGYAVFYGCASLETAVLSSGLAAIDSFAFYNCAALTSITIPDSVTSIGYAAFYGCASLETAVLSSGLAAIDSSAFYNCAALTSITIPNSVTSLGRSVFYGCTSLETAVLSSGLTAINDYTFYNCSGLTSVTVPDSVTSIGYYSFYRCGRMKFRVIRDSYAHQFALDHGIPHVVQGEEEPEIPETANTVSEKVQQIVAEVIRPGMTDYQKALALHNYLTSHANYDYTYTYYSANGVLLLGTGVCQSYTLAYGLLLDAVGISNWEETGDDHIWNVALLDGVWCHIDVTWDDPGEGGAEQCEWFGITDYALEGVRNHEREKRKNPCDDYRISYVYKNGLLDTIVNDWKDQIRQKAANGEYNIVLEGAMLYPHGIKERMAYQMLCAEGITVNGTSIKPETRFEFDSDSYQLYIAYDPNVQPEWTFTLPSSLTAVEEEAFMGIRANAVMILPGCTEIGARAFADSAVKAIFIPASVNAIGTDAIPADVTIFTVPGSMAAQWGGQNGYTVIEVQ